MRFLRVLQSPLIVLGTTAQRLVDAILRRQLRASGLESLRDHSFLTSHLDEHSTVVDLGAHLGEFSSELNHRFGCRCVAVEPAPDLFARIPNRNGVARVNAAINDRGGTVRLHYADNPEGNTVDPVLARVHGSSRSVEVRAITFDELRAEHGIDRIDLLKIDIEGAEIGLLLGISDRVLDRIDQITVEFHDFIPGYEAGEAIERILQRLRDAGFLVLAVSKPYGNHLDVLALHERRMGLGLRARLHLRGLLLCTLPVRTALERMKHLVRRRSTPETA